MGKRQTQADSNKKFTGTPSLTSLRTSAHITTGSPTNRLGTSYIVVFRSENGEVVSHECDASDYYSYEIGKTYIFHREIYW